MARDRPRSTASIVLDAADKQHVAAALKPIMAPDAILCTDGGGALAAAAYHVQNVNAYDSRLKGWIARFQGVASHYLANYLGWHRLLDRAPRYAPEPAQILASAVGAQAIPS